MKEEKSIVNNRKSNQRNKMLFLIRTNENISKNDLKKFTSYSMTTVTSAVSELISGEFIYEEICNDTRVGRKPIWLRINPEGGYFLGIEFNRHLMCCSILNFKLEKIYFSSCQIMDEQKNVDSIIKLIICNIQDGIAALGKDSARIIGIGLGVPGYIDKAKGIALSYNHFTNWKNVHLKDIVQKKFNIPCYIDNNVNVMIYPYKWLKYNGKCEDMLFLSVRTGARVIPVINNHPVKSSLGYAGEIGHIKVYSGSRLCECGRFGCLNSEISDVAVVNKIKEGMDIGKFCHISSKYGQNTSISTDMFIDAVRANDKDAIKLLERSAMYLGQVLAELINIFAPLKVVIYGIYSPVGNLFIEMLKQYTVRNTIAENFDRVDIQISAFGPELGSIGAALLVLEDSFSFVDDTV